MTPNLLVEILVEELPPKALKTLGESFASSLAASLQRDGLAQDTATVTAYATPRRLAAHISGVLPVAVDRAISQKLMPVSVGLDQSGAPTPALLKKLAALGADASAVEGLRRENDGKTDNLFYDSTVKGMMLAEGLQKAIETALAALPIPKVMSYQLADGWTSVNFVRPAHSLLALHGASVVPVTALGLSAGKVTLGHRFEGSCDPITIEHADYYARTLLDRGAVIASFAERRAEIVRQLTAAAAKAGPNLSPVEDDALLDEVTALVERPNVLIGQFEPEFLEVPQECLILTMKANQKYFPLLDTAGRLTHHFLIVSNLSPSDPSAIISGNERVVRPRLADAKFFFDQDRKKTLESRLPALEKVVYHNKLGNQLERSKRVTGIAREIVNKLPEDLKPKESVMLDNRVKLAASIAKADLLTDMVGEFPELQGIMGRYYAFADGFHEDVANAVEDHYKPRFAGDALPRGKVGMVVALADKLETLTGMFGIGQTPTGDKDPFALRRHALGVIRILTEGGLNVPLSTLLDLAAAQFKGLFAGSKGGLQEFIFDRLAVSLREQGYTAQEVDAVLSLAPQLLSDIPKRLAAVRAFAALPEADALAAANKRVGNILKKAEEVKKARKISASLLKEPAEIALAEALDRIVPEANAAFEAGDYSASLQALAALREPVDAFFDKVMVNVENTRLRANRLALLAQLHGAMNRVADLSRLSA